MSKTFNIWPKWARRIEEIKITYPQPWQTSPWDKAKRRDWFHVNDNLQHHPGKLPWWKLFTILVAPHKPYRQRICHLWVENPHIGWNIWIYFRNGGAVCIDITIVRGLPRVLKAAK